METIYDWVAIIIFAGLATLFLQRSLAPIKVDHLWQYLPPALGCATGNYAGNEGWPIPAFALFAATVGYVFYVLKPGRLEA